MTPYERIAIYQRLDHDRDVAEKEIPCSAFGNCRGVRDPHHAPCRACPLAITQQREPWQERFLFHLAYLRRVNEAIKKAEVGSKTVYQERATNPEFRAKWEAALAQ
jgi:hypothetical protein